METVCALRSTVLISPAVYTWLLLPLVPSPKRKFTCNFNVFFSLGRPFLHHLFFVVAFFNDLTGFVEWFSLGLAHLGSGCVVSGDSPTDTVLCPSCCMSHERLS